MTNDHQLSDAGLAPPPVSPASPPPTLPLMPLYWQATVILHPFSPPPGPEPDPSPFFELCIANVLFIAEEYLSVQILGQSGRTWWYAVGPGGSATLSQSGQASPIVPDPGWVLPSTGWMSGQRYFASGPLNWMTQAAGSSVDWWTQPASGANPNAATWMWFDSVSGAPVRMMFGAPPPSPSTGTPDQLALFQNFAFIYFAEFSEVVYSGNSPTWEMPSVENFSFGDAGLDLFVWNSNFGMSPMMTPVNQSSNPLPTTVDYHWAADSAYQVLADRAQRTQMSYTFNSQNPGDPAVDTILMFGAAPPGTANPPPLAGHWLDYTVSNAGAPHCSIDPGGLQLGAEAPDWVSTTGEGGTIWAVIDSHPVLAPENQVGIYSVIFPPSDQYPQGRFLWTWYSPMPGSNGARARPVTFMESASSISEGGTSLALADYYDYQEFAQPIDPSVFAVPSACQLQSE
jgi:hypothetical protein